MLYLVETSKSFFEKFSTKSLMLTLAEEWKLESQCLGRYLGKMKRVEAIIRPHRLSEALTALVKLRVTGVTVVDSLGFGINPGHSDVFEQSVVHRDGDLEIGVVPKKLLIMYVEDANVRPVVDTIAQIARTGYPGDGKIAISQLEELVRVRVDA